jgi:carboxyl-terminal processing protease
MIGEIAETFDKKYYKPVSQKMMLTDAAEKMISSTDSYAHLLPPEALELGMDRNYGRVNVKVVIKNGMTKVVSPIQGTHAFKSGIRTGDRIIRIDGKPVSSVWWKFSGKYGTSAILTVVRDGTEKPIEIKILRDMIPMVSLTSSVTTDGYAYIRISYFQNMTADRFGKELEQFEHSDITLKGLILDLRYNPGGLLDEAINVSNYFLEKGIIVSVKSRIKKNIRTFYADSVGKQRSYPIIVLINKGTAGITEVVAGSLQDRRRAMILGSHSYGLGTVQSAEPLSNGYGVCLTIAQYITPNGHEIEGKGITPDVFFDPLLNTDKEGRDLTFSDSDIVIKAAVEILKKSPSGKPEDMSATAGEVIKDYEKTYRRN